jgi:hypothetical protein
MLQLSVATVYGAHITNLCVGSGVHLHQQFIIIIIIITPQSAVFNRHPRR